MAIPTLPTFSAGQILTSSVMNDVSLLGNYQGLFHIKTQTIGNAVSSVTVTSAFSSDFDNYLITVTGGTFNTTLVWGVFQFSSAHTTGYYGAAQFIDTAGAATAQGTSNLGRLLVTRSSTTTAGVSSWSINVANPTSAVRKSIWGQCSGGNMVTHGGYYDSTSSLTQFVLSPSAGTLTGGTIRVYGYRNSL
jgi:hypothetical protein